MLYLVQLTYAPRALPEQVFHASERITAPDPDAAIGDVRALYAGRAKGHIHIERLRAIPDYIVRFDGSIALVYPQTEQALEWLEDHVGDDAQWMGRALAVEHRYVQDLVDNLKSDGFTVGV